MLWFNKEKKKRMEFFQSFVPSSKAQLIKVAMYMNNGDIQKAQEFVDFYTKNMRLPDFDPVQPTAMQQIKEGASGFYAWIKENQGDLIQGYQFFQSIIKNKGTLPFTSTEAETPLEPINE